jgi:hypothetical protein
MQAANRRSCDLIAASCEGDGGAPAGNSFWHARCADWNWGELGSMPLPAWIEKLPLVGGSGKFGTPCERMQDENRIPIPSFALPAAVDPEAAVPPGVVVVVEGVGPRLATEGEGVLPPQPAATTARSTAAADAAHGRRRFTREGIALARLRPGIRNCYSPVTRDRQS